MGLATGCCFSSSSSSQPRAAIGPAAASPPSQASPVTAREVGDLGGAASGASGTDAGQPVPASRPSRRVSFQVVSPELIQPSAVAPRSCVAGLLQEGLARALPPKQAPLGSPDLHGDNAMFRYRSAITPMDWTPDAPDHDVQQVRRRDCQLCW